MENPDVEGLIELPKLENKGDWTKKFKTRIKKAEEIILISDSVDIKIQKLKKLASKNKYTLEVYERVNELVNLTPRLIILLKLFDQSKSDEERIIASAKISYLKKEFFELKDRFEETYSKTRIINKPQNYILDQDHHNHLANQMLSFNWQFTAELMMFEKISNQLKALPN